jgi:hypothetical protein
MKSHVERNTLEDDRVIDDIVQAACQLAGRQDMYTVHVISPQQLTHTELRHLRECANQQGVELTVETCHISFQRTPYPAECRNKRPSVLDRFRAQSKSWQASLEALAVARVRPRLQR